MSDYFTLQANPRNIGEIFFSGSQTVEKGQSVSWILDETYAFKTTEAVGVSCDSTPFVQLDKGETFIIKKGALYIFDSDTVVALAYPQEITQDIVIENDIYNNNLSTIIVEADKTPVAKLTATKSSCELGDTVVFSAGASYSPDNPPQDLTYRWLVQGQEVSTAVTWTYTANIVGAIDILLIVEDEDGRYGDAAYTLAVNERTYVSEVFTDTTQTPGSIPVNSWTEIFTIYVDKDIPNAQNAVQFSASFGQTWNTTKTYYPASVGLRFRVINGSNVFTGTYTNTNTEWQKALTIVDQFTFDYDLSAGDSIEMSVIWYETGNQHQGLRSVCDFCIDGDLQMTSTEQP